MQYGVDFPGVGGFANAALLASLAQEAGVTWRLGDLPFGRYPTIEASRKRLRQGPPGGR